MKWRWILLYWIECNRKVLQEPSESRDTNTWSIFLFCPRYIWNLFEDTLHSHDKCTKQRHSIKSHETKTKQNTHSYTHTHTERASRKVLVLPVLSSPSIVLLLLVAWPALVAVATPILTSTTIVAPLVGASVATAAAYLTVWLGTPAAETTSNESAALAYVDCYTFRHRHKLTTTLHRTECNTTQVLA